MRIKKDYVLRCVAGTWVVLPLGAETVNFGEMMTLNGSGARLWCVLEQGADRDMLISTLLEEYEVSAEQAAVDVDEFLEKLKAAGCLEETV